MEQNETSDREKSKTQKEESNLTLKSTKVKDEEKKRIEEGPIRIEVCIKIEGGGRN